jgi:Flp pilus assembly protein CpaB
MEMEFKDTGRRRRVLVVMLGAALALTAGWGAFTLASKGGPAEAVATRSVLVAARDIPARTPVTADDLVVRQVPIDEALAQSYESQDVVVGRITSVPIYTDQQITPSLFATTTADADFSILGPEDTVTETSPYWRAVAVQVPSERAVGGEIKAGQHVDLIVSVEIDVLTQDAEGNYVKTDTANTQGFQSGESTKITFQDVEVLKSTPDDNMYVLKVDLHQAEQIAHVVQVAPDSMSLVLRPDEDTRTADTSQYGTTTDRLIMTYLFPAPQLIDLSKLLGPTGVSSPGSSPIPGGSPSGSPAPSESPAPEGSPSPETSPQPGETPSPTPGS